MAETSQAGTQFRPEPRLAGANITVKPEHLGKWKNFYVEWDWDGWIRWQIDQAIEVGANSVRVIGDIGCVADGDLTQEAYLDRQRQYLEYCGEKGLRVYACGGDRGHFGTASQEDVCRQLAAHAKLIDGYTHVTCFDVLQEVGLSWVRNVPDRAEVLSRCREISAAVRAETAIPITYSHPTPRLPFDSAMWECGEELREWEPLVDYYDFHIYYVPKPGDMAPLFAATNLTVLIGEFGAPVSAHEEQRAAQYRAVADLVAPTGARGAFQWAVGDQDTRPENQWGLFGIDRRPRPAVIEEFRALVARIVSEPAAS